MSKKYLNIVGVLGIIFLVLGFVINPYVFGKVKSLHNEWSIARFYLFSFHLLVVGTIFLLSFLLIKKSTKTNSNKYFLLVVFFASLGIVVVGFIFSPSFAVNNLIPTKFLADDGKNRLLSFQLYAITGGLIVVIISLLVFLKRNYASFLWRSILTLLIGLIGYLFLMKVTYINYKYPSNIIFKTSEYKNVTKLLLGQDILLSEFEPKSILKVNNKVVKRAKFPVIDINFHLSSGMQSPHDAKICNNPDTLIELMNLLNIRILVNSDGKIKKLEKVLNTFAEKYPGRVINFWPSGFPAGIITDKRLAELPIELENEVNKGALGDGELWKNLGLKTKDSSGKLLVVDDPRIDPLWDKAGELGIPILWHMGDPPNFFMPIDRHNETYEMLRVNSDWSYNGPQFPSMETILKQRENVFKKHPNTIFIGCHFGFTPHDLSYTSYLLDTYPNYYVELSTVLSQLGRQPFTARKFFIKYQDRILFGTDSGNSFDEKGWTFKKIFRTYFEFLETENEFFEYPFQGAVDQGYWKIYGLNLPDEVLEKVYHLNAEKLIFKSKTKN
jgi:uncharacterized protein